MRPLSIAFFERVPALPGTALMRLAGRVDPELTGGVEPILVVDDGRTSRDFVALKAPNRFAAGSGAFVLPFAVPVESLGKRPAFALRVSAHYTAGGTVASGATTRAFRATASAASATKRNWSTRTRRQAALGPAQRRTYGRRGPGKPRQRALPPAAAKKPGRL